jgi:hypothetical protein
MVPKQENKYFEFEKKVKKAYIQYWQEMNWEKVD